ncbi:putative phosphatase [Bacillus sp. TS-2]|nr:putative phosphatase [Bacillus sp. TS-2]
MSLIKGVILDMDGVIANTLELQYEVNLELAKKLNINFTRKDNQLLQGLSRRETVKSMIKRSEQEMDHNLIEELSTIKNDRYQKLIQNLTKEDIMPGMESFIKELYQRNIPIAVASASQNAKKVIHSLQLESYISYIVDVKTLKKGKPDPEIFLTAAKAIQIEPRDCVAVEDGDAGMLGILKTEMFSVGIGNSEILQKADWTIPNTSELTYKRLMEKI